MGLGRDILRCCVRLGAGHGLCGVLWLGFLGDVLTDLLKTLMKLNLMMIFSLYHGTPSSFLMIQMIFSRHGQTFSYKLWTSMYPLNNIE